MEETTNDLRWERYNNVLKFIKRNYTFLAILPLLVGGTLQLGSLFSMTPKFIRFFSTSQMIKDGLIFVSAFTPLIIWVILVHIYFGNLHKRKEFSILIIGPTIFVLLLTPFYKFSSSFQEDPSLFIFIITSILTGIFQVILLINSFYFKTGQKRILSIFSLLAFILMGALIYLDRDKISYSKVDGLGNYENVECYLKKQYYYNEEYEVEYFNDEFIFVRFIDEGKPEIRIIPFDVMMNDTYCD